MITDDKEKNNEKKIKNFLSNNCVTIPMFISLACIAIWNSTVALVIYTAIMHFLLLFLIIGLYRPDVVRNPPDTIKNKSSIKRILSVAAHTFVVTIILVITEHWYTLCISLSCIFLVSVYLHDWAKDASAE